MQSANGIQMRALIDMITEGETMTRAEALVQWIEENTPSGIEFDARVENSKAVNICWFENTSAGVGVVLHFVRLVCEKADEMKVIIRVGFKPEQVEMARFYKKIGFAFSKKDPPDYVIWARRPR